jgi:hypothetical protein
MKRRVGTQRILTAQMKCRVGTQRNVAFISIYLFLFNLNGGKAVGFFNLKKLNITFCDIENLAKLSPKKM